VGVPIAFALAILCDASQCGVGPYLCFLSSERSVLLCWLEVGELEPDANNVALKGYASFAGTSKSSCSANAVSSTKKKHPIPPTMTPIRKAAVTIAAVSIWSELHYLARPRRRSAPGARSTPACRCLGVVVLGWTCLKTIRSPSRYIDTTRSA
jgi:hypothetical protein